MVCIVLAIVFWAALPAYSQQQQQQQEATGLLLGMQTIQPAPEPLPFYADAPDSMAAPSFSTLLVTRRDTSIGVDSTAGLFIPGPDTLWQVGVKRSVYNDWVEDFLWARPAGRDPVYSGISTFNGEYCSGHRTQRLLYVGQRFISFAQRSAGSCRGSAHPWYYRTLATIPIDSTEHLGLAIDEVLGYSALDTFRAATDQFLDTLTVRQREGFVHEPDPANWALVRYNGNWVVQGRLGPVSEASGNASADLFLNVDPFHPEAPRAARWDQLTAARDSLLDAFPSPDGTWLVLLYDGKLTVHERDEDGAPRHAIYSMPLPPRTRAVAVRWLPKEALARIERQAKAIQHE